MNFKSALWLAPLALILTAGCPDGCDQPTPVYPCGACGYKQSDGTVDGVMKMNSQQPCKYKYTKLDIKLTYDAGVLPGGAVSETLPLNPHTMTAEGRFSGSVGTEKSKVKNAVLLFDGFSDRADGIPATGCFQQLDLK